MIFYFSATENSRHVAEEIAAKTDDKAVFILDLKQSELTLSLEKNVGFVSPTYAFGLPVVVSDFLKSVNFKIYADSYVFFISTYGTTPGVSTVIARKLLKKKGVKLDSVFGVKMPDTWTPIFDLSDKEKVSKINEKADAKIAEVIHKIIEKKQCTRIQRQLPLIAFFVSKIWYESMRKTKNLYVEDSCTGCGLCAKKCPVNAIEIIGKKPVWKKEKCAMCLGCLHRCPKFAIQYGNGATKRHGQYENPKSSKIDINIR